MNIKFDKKLINDVYSVTVTINPSFTESKYIKKHEPILINIGGEINETIFPDVFKNVFVDELYFETDVKETALAWVAKITTDLYEIKEDLVDDDDFTGEVWTNI